MMDVYRPLRAGLFFYELLRLLLLVIFLLILSPEGGALKESGMPAGGGFSDNIASGAFFPYLVYLSSNALFPLMVLFVWLRPEEYRNYLTLYMAGKIIAVVSFYAWEIFTVRVFPGPGNMARSIILIGGSIFLSFTDILSVWGAWVLKNKFRRILTAEHGGI